MTVPQFVLRDAAEFSCPEGYQKITDATKCESASVNLGLVYRGDRNTNHDDRVCHFCGGCPDTEGGKSTRVDETHGIYASWICEWKGK